MKAGWWKSQLNPISMQNKRCPEPKAEARVQIHAGSFGRRAPARCLPGRAAHAAFPKRAFPAIRPQGSRKEPCQLAAARDHSARSTAQGPSHISMDSCHQGWEPERRRSCFTCTLQLWMQSTIVFFQPCCSEGDFKVFPHSHRVRVSPCVTELNFGSKLGIYTAGNNIQEGVDDMKLLIDHDVIHWEAHTLWVKTASLKKKEITENPRLSGNQVPQEPWCAVVGWPGQVAAGAAGLELLQPFTCSSSRVQQCSHSFFGSGFAQPRRNSPSVGAWREKKQRLGQEGVGWGRNQRAPHFLKL